MLNVIAEAGELVIIRCLWKLYRAIRQIRISRTVKPCCGWMAARARSWHGPEAVISVA